MDNFEKSCQLLLDEKIKYHPAIDALMEQISVSLEQRDYQQVKDYLEEVKRVGDGVGNGLEKAQIRLECAIVEYKMRRIPQSITELNTSIHLLESIKDQTPNNAHYLAVVLWLYGCLLLQYTSEPSMIDRTKAISALQNSLDIFDIYFRMNNQFVKCNWDWYHDRSKYMRQVIRDTAKRNSPSGKDIHHNWSKNHPSTDIPTNKKTDRKKARIIPDGLGHIYVIGEIRAGPFSSSVLFGDIIDIINLNSAMEEFFLNSDSKPYDFLNLRDSGQMITLHPGRNYYALKVIGDSMDKAGIDPDDYVLVQQLKSPDHGDIVVAEIANEATEDHRATLKQFFRREGDIHLSPVSNNPNHKRFVFTAGNGGKFQILGIAIGVFAPIK